MSSASDASNADDARGASDAGDASSAEAAVDPCADGRLEPDLMMPAPLAGPGVDPATGQLREFPDGGYVVSTTYGHNRPDQLMHFNELLQPILTELAGQDGLIAMQLSFSPQCGTGRTLAVWRDEAAMYNFVASAPHAAAMPQVSSVTYDFAVTHYRANSAADATWQAAAVEMQARLHGP